MLTTYSFAPGPAMLPPKVRERIHEEWLDWQGLGVSPAEVGHRTEIFVELMQKTEADLRDLMKIPENYQVLFLQGGAQGQFALAPMNLLGNNPQADYLVYGLWSEKATQEAQRYGQIRKINALQASPKLTVSPENEWEFNSEAAYLHYCTNETVDGIRINKIPKAEVPLVADMSSDILSEPVNVSQFGVIYACAQKNLGVAGVTIVIVRDDLLDQSMEITPSVLSYQKQARQHSMYNTMPTLSCYITSLMLEWIQAEGGVDALAKRNRRQADRLYKIIDAYPDFYFNKIDPTYRSLMNVTFFLQKESLEREFLKQAEARGLLFLKGHSTRGGIRACIYNGMPDEGVERLAELMEAFVR